MFQLSGFYCNRLLNYGNLVSFKFLRRNPDRGHPSFHGAFPRLMHAARMSWRVGALLPCTTTIDYHNYDFCRLLI